MVGLAGRDGVLRYVAVGDSQTEGLNDGSEGVGYRGWADRLAERLAGAGHDVRYANLAIRGRLAGQIRAEQVAPALALKPDLVSVMAGMNDVVRPGVVVGAVAAELEAMYAAFAGTGATVLTFTFPDVARIAPLVRHLRPRVVEFNALIREAAARHGVLVVDTFHHEISVDRRLWSTDRIHATPLGHARMAAAAAHTLNLPDADDWATPLPPLPPASRWRHAADEAAWVATFVGPWILRRLRGRSSGDNRTAKRPDLLPLQES
ncbi:SGNH/GDSL hydrolase family protein [Actinocorallia sp. API 0066]|uniref:SGNH/GDSL hydrolase family protein n=1 Tax=Actinocorallia sp. API 0066 TaxID=2896846 RepID=UPI001E58497C|nr:SGNH/GDSL hydrolase family protein [Actinocorallia sp. API 0066]MCD0449215.1 SGNH/GDSL hydrolase family protein [Actinocorallia sp. API 0066]